MHRYLAAALLAFCLPACCPAPVTRTERSSSPKIAEDLPSLMDDLESVPIRGAQFVEIPGSPEALPVSEEWEWRDYRVQVVHRWHDLPWGDQRSVFTCAAVVISQAGNIVFSRLSFDSDFTIGGLAGKRTEVDSAGRRDLVISGESGGVHSHKFFWLCELGPEFRLSAELDGPSDCSPGFSPLPGEPAPLFTTSDRAFDGWRTASCDEERIPIILRRVGSEWFAAPDLMEKPAPTSAELDELEKAARPAFESDWFSHEPCNSVLRHEMLELIATGHESVAWELFAAVWPVDLPGKEGFEAEFRKRLDDGRYWKALRSSGHRLDPAPPETFSR